MAKYTKEEVDEIINAFNGVYRNEGFNILLKYIQRETGISETEAEALGEIYGDIADIIYKNIPEEYVKYFLIETKITRIWELQSEDYKMSKILEIAKEKPDIFPSIWRDSTADMQLKKSKEVLEIVKEDSKLLRKLWHSNKVKENNEIGEAWLDAAMKNNSEYSAHTMIQIFGDVSKEVQSKKIKDLVVVLSKEDKSSIWALLDNTSKEVIQEKIGELIEVAIDNLDVLPIIFEYVPEKEKNEKLLDTLAAACIQKENGKVLLDLLDNFSYNVKKELFENILSQVKEHPKMFDEIWRRWDLVREDFDKSLEIIGMSDKKELILELAETNDDIYMVTPRILEDKYVESFGKSKINLIASYPKVLERVLEIGDSENGNKKIRLIAKCIEEFQKENENTDEWTPYASRVFDNIETYNDLIANLDLDKLTTEQLSSLTNLLLHENIYNIKNMEQVDNVKKMEMEQCERDIKSDDIEDKKQAVLVSKLGLTTEEAKILIQKFGEDIDKVKDEDLKYCVKSIKIILDMTSGDDKEVLEEMYANVEPVVHRNPMKLERMLKTEYGKMYKEGLFRVEQCDRMDGNLFVAGTNFKMMITSVAPFYENDIENYYIDWNRRSLGSQHFCASYIRNDMLGTVYIPHICYGFSEMADDALMLAGSQDIYSTASNFVSSASHNEAYYTPDTQIDKTDKWNEMCFRRIQNGEKKQPDYIVVFAVNDRIENLGEAYKASQEFTQDERFPNGLPIVVIDVNECLEAERGKLEEMLVDFQVNSTKEQAEKILRKVHNNQVTERAHDIKDYLTIDGLNLRELKDFLNGKSEILEERKDTTVKLEDLRENDDSVGKSQREKSYEMFIQLAKMKDKNLSSSNAKENKSDDFEI